MENDLDFFTLAEQLKRAEGTVEIWKRTAETWREKYHRERFWGRVTFSLWAGTVIGWQLWKLFPRP